MNSFLSNQEPKALVNYMETYFKHTTPDITLISEENFKINVHKEMFYQTQLMCTMIKSTDSDYCCSKVSVICLIPKEELKLIVQFLYSGKLFFKNQKELSQLSENLSGLFGFPKIHSSSKIEPKLQTASDSISKEDLVFNLKKSSIPKGSRKQHLTSALVRDEFTEDLVSIKIEPKNLVDETKLVEPSERKKSRKQSLTTASIRNEFIDENLVIQTDTKEHSNDADFNNEDITDPLAHITTAHTLSDIQKNMIRCAICDISYAKDKGNIKLGEHLKSEHNVKVEDVSTIWNKRLGSKKKLNAHVIRHHRDEKKEKDTKSEVECTICNKVFKTKNVRAKHIFLKHRDACNVCLEQFESKQHLEAHIKTAHSLSDFQKRLRCVICDFCYSKKDKDRSKLWKHMKFEHNVGYICPICQKKLPSKLILKQHNTQEHKHKTVIKESNLCFKCGKSFKIKISLDSHVSKNCGIQMRGNKCSICGDTFESRSLKMEHVATKHKDVKLYDCTECSSQYITETGLKTHISYAHGNKVGSVCPICGKILKTAAVLKGHISYMHEGKVKPKFKCSLCEESYATPQALENHMSVHEGKIFQCSNCNEEFNSKNKLEGHIAKEHDRSKLYKCEHCDSAYVTKNALVSHIAFVHDKTISNVCQHCGKNCMSKADLKKHIKIVHELSGKHPYKCEVCKKSFKLETLLKSHIKIIHEGRRVKCPVCQKPFVSKTVMKLHIKTVHEKKKPYLCDICNERFAQSGHLVTHKKGKHKLAM